MSSLHVIRLSAVLGMFALFAGCSPDAPPAPTTPPPPPAAPAAPAALPAQPAPPAADQGLAAPTVTLTESDNEQVVTLQRGEVVELRLKADRMSGLTWVPLANMQPAMRTDGMPQYEPDDEATPHASGTEVWRFVAVQPGHVHLRFQYVRPHDRNGAPAATVVYHIDIE